MNATTGPRLFRSSGGETCSVTTDGPGVTRSRTRPLPARGRGQTELPFHEPHGRSAPASALASSRCTRETGSLSAAPSCSAVRSSGRRAGPPGAAGRPPRRRARRLRWSRLAATARSTGSTDQAQPGHRGRPRPRARERRRSHDRRGRGAWPWPPRASWRQASPSRDGVSEAMTRSTTRRSSVRVRSTSRGCRLVMNQPTFTMPSGVHSLVASCSQVPTVYDRRAIRASGGLLHGDVEEGHLAVQAAGARPPHAVEDGAAGDAGQHQSRGLQVGGGVDDRGG